MFVYYWFPGYLFTALSSFSWITWIAPNNAVLDTICGMNGGMGFNPWPSFDWNIAYAGGYVPLTIPTFTVVNLAISATVGCLMYVAEIPLLQDADSAQGTCILVHKLLEHWLLAHQLARNL